MTPNEFYEKLKRIPVEAPDELDKEMLAEAAAEDDGTLVDLNDLKRELEDYSGRLVLRIPRSLHKALKDAAAIEGVSLNQYMIYKLSR